MLSFRNTCIIFYIITVIKTGNSYENYYFNTTLDSWNCAYDVYCSDTIGHIYSKIDDLNQFYYNDRNNFNNYQDSVDGNQNGNENYNIMLSSNLHICHYISYNGMLFHPLHLSYRRSDVTSQNIPRYNTRVLITYFDLSYNNYELIPTLYEMNNLAVLNVSNNGLTVAELSNTVDFINLVEIDLSHNIINDINHKYNYIYRGLKKINLSYNYFTKIPEAVFDPFNLLETLDLSHNYIEILSPITFEGIKQLKYLNISHNRISDINSSLFRFNELKLLDLSNNNIKTIKSTDFNKLTNLIKLNLEFNFISKINKESFDNIPSLRSLNLNNNKLSNLDNFIFVNTSNIDDIDLSDNIIKKIPKSLFRGKNIHLFSIKRNQLQGSLKNGMFEGIAAEKLDLSNQYLDTIEDNAFDSLTNLKVLSLNYNNISVLATKSFGGLVKLTMLDLSFNKIQSIEFEKHDLYNLLSLSLRNNYLSFVKQENFYGLNQLQFLDLSDNKITQVESNSFISLKELINFQISNNPLNGTLEESTFDGFSSLPSLDISCTLLSSIHNGSFIGMVELKNLNVSHSKINYLEYNIFVHTGAVDILDFSFNELKDFVINSTELTRLNALYLNNNFIKTLDSSTFENIVSLSKLSLSYNMIQNMNYEFTSQKYLRILDISYNPNLNVNLPLLNVTKAIDSLDLSGIKTKISFENIKDTSLSHLTITNASIFDVKQIQLNELRHLDDLNLSNNIISKLKVGSFNNINNIRFLDLSCNKIKEIQPGIFKDNTMLVSLNVSHNYLTTVSYGIFQGLIYLSTLDISYNFIKDLQNERFYEVTSLSVLIADHNKIETITAEEFLGTSLTKLSIGGNPISCDVLVNLKRHNVPFEITAKKLYENNDENVNGVTCNRKQKIDRETNISSGYKSDNENTFHRIRDILLDLLNNQHTRKSTTNLDENYLMNITDQIRISNADINSKITSFLNSTAKHNETNILLNKILRVLTLNSATRAPPIQVTKDNATYENLISYIDKIKQDLEYNYKIDKDSILNEIEAKIEARISTLNSQNNILLSTETPKYEKLSVSDESRSLLTETCVVLILVILVGFVLFKVYKSGVFVRKRFSVSTRELPGSMDSTL